MGGYWLIGCEESQKVCAAFRAAGALAFSCDVQPTRGDHPEWHLQADLFEVLQAGPEPGQHWRGAILHPECRYLSVSGQHWNHRKPGRLALVEQAVAFGRRCINAADEFGLEFLCVENPISILSTRVRKPDQIVHPFNYGHDASKATCLWLHRLPKLEPQGYVEPRMVCPECKSHTPWPAWRGCLHCGAESALLRPRWANQTDTGQNRLGPSPTRSRDRAETYDGIATAMARQWAHL